MGIYPIQKWEVPDKLLLFVAITTTIACSVIIFPLLMSIFEIMLAVLNEYIVFEVSSGIVSKIIIGVLGFILAIYLNSLLFVRWLILSISLVQFWGVSPWIAYPVMFIPDFIVFVAAFIVDIQIWFLTKDKELIKDKDEFARCAEKIKKETKLIRKDHEKGSDPHGALGFTVKYITTTLEYIFEGKTKYPGHLRSDFVISSTNNYALNKNPELVELVKKYAKTFELEKFIGNERMGSKFSKTIFEN